MQRLHYNQFGNKFLRSRSFDLGLGSRSAPQNPDLRLPKLRQIAIKIGALDADLTDLWSLRLFSQRERDSIQEASPRRVRQQVSRKFLWSDRHRTQTFPNTWQIKTKKNSRAQRSFSLFLLYGSLTSLHRLSLAL